MVNLQTSCATPNDLAQVALDCIRLKNYEQAIQLYEQRLEDYPASQTDRWYLGLAYLLQGHESEAQLTWSLVLTEAEPEQAEAWALELISILEAEATQQADAGDYLTARYIRQHIGEIDPTNVTNLLHSVDLDLKLDSFGFEQLDQLGMTEALSQQTLSRSQSDLLGLIIENILELFRDDIRAFSFIKACIPYIADQSILIDKVLLPTATTLSSVLGLNILACRYGELILQIDAQHSGTLVHLSRFYIKEGRYEESISLANRYYQGCQTLLQKVFGNGVVLRSLMGTGANWAEATSYLKQQTHLLQSCISSYQIDPDFPLDSSILCAPLFFYPYFDDCPAETRSLQNQVAHLVQTSLHTHLKTKQKDYQPFPIAPRVRTTDRKKLRIGYIAQFMRRHSVGWLSRWVFEHFDRDRFEVYAYFNRHIHIEAFTDQWFASKATRACCFNGDALGIAQAIREDEIDILIDLDSITSDDTCNVMAMKSAPVQVTWLGLDASGLPAVDYFLADPYVLPEQAQDYYEERIWRLPQTYVAVDGFEVGIPTLRRDRLGIPEDAITYFSSQSSYKRNPQMIRLQMQIIRQVPNSFFLIKGAGDQQEIAALFRQLAEESGVSVERLRFLPQDTDELTHRANLSIADVVLDTFPYNGATTTLETLWMGIPIVTKVGQQFAARNSYTFMINAGITEGISWTDAEYIEWGIRLGQDAQLRQQIAWKLRQSRQNSPLWNGKQFTHDLETAYEQMWDIYLKKNN
jgi:predicted O-linked N-acetylglucosamine transferase (SPINDLY family)